MAKRPEADAVTILLDGLGRLGRPGLELGVRLDLLRAIGPGAAWRRSRQESVRAKLEVDPAERRYRRIWEEAARELGAEVIDLSAGFLEIRRDASWTRVWRHWVMLDDAVTLRLALDKEIVHRLLLDAALPLPEHVEFDSRALAPALAFLRRTGAPCVIKPAAASGGSGTTSSIRSPAQLRRARLRAARVSSRLLIERQVSGDVYRFLFLDGDLLGVVRRLQPTVTGDGRSSVGELIFAENRRRAASAELATPLLKVDLDCVFTLARTGLTLASVPPRGTRIQVKTVVSQNAPEENETVHDGAADELTAEGARAVRALGLRLAGVDIVTEDLSRPLSASGGVILEVNGTPGLHYHYEVSDPASAIRVAVPILRKLLG